MIIDYSEPHICFADRSMIQILVYQFYAFISIDNALFGHVETYNSIIQIDVDSSLHSRINFHNCIVIMNVLSHFLDFHYTDNCSSTTDSTKYHPRITVTFVEISISYNIYALINDSNSIMQLITSSKCLQFKLDIKFMNVVFQRNKLALLRVLSKSQKLNNHYSISIYTERHYIVQDNNVEYHDSLILLENVQIQFNGITTFFKNCASELILLIDAQIEFNGISRIFVTSAYTLVSLTSGELQFIGETELNSNNDYELLLLSDAQVYFNGSTRFTNNNAIEIIQSTSSQLYFSNSTLLEGNDVMQIITLYPKLFYLLLLGNANVTFSNNIVHDEMIKVVTIYNHPYPYCLFQYYVPDNSKPEDFHINLVFNYKDSPDAGLVKEIDSISKLTSQFNWTKDSAFQNSTPFSIHNKVINIRLMNNTLSYQLSKHSIICSCQQSLEYDCNDNQIGPIYPGQNLTVDLCLPYNAEDVGILCAETCSDNMPTSICKISDSDSVKHVFNQNQARKLLLQI